MVCGELTLQLLPDSIREWRLECELASCSGSIFHCEKQTELIAHRDHMHEHVMIVWLVSQMRSNSSSFFSLYRCTCLKNLRKLEHWVLAGDKFLYHPEGEFVPFSVCKVVGCSCFSIFPGLFRSWITETPITRSEFCCVSSHFSRWSSTFILHLHTFPVAISLNMVAEMILSGQLSGTCPVFDMTYCSLCSSCTDVSPRHMCHSMSID